MTSELPAASPSPDAGRAVRHALGWMVVSCMLFAIVMVAVRMLLHDLPPTQTAFLRYVVGIGLLMPFVGRQIPQIWRSPARGGFLARGILHAIAVSFWFYSIKVIPLADVNAILNLGPVWATIGAALFLGERLRLRRIMAILVSFAGAMIIIKPGFSDIVPGTWAVMVTAAFFAFSDLIAKQLKAHHDDNLIIMALSVTIALVSPISHRRLAADFAAELAWRVRHRACGDTRPYVADALVRRAHVGCSGRQIRPAPVRYPFRHHAVRRDSDPVHACGCHGRPVRRDLYRDARRPPAGG